MKRCKGGGERSPWLIYPRGGMTPILCSRPNVSQLLQASSICPSVIRNLGRGLVYTDHKVARTQASPLPRWGKQGGFSLLYLALAILPDKATDEGQEEQLAYN